MKKTEQKVERMMRLKEVMHVTGLRRATIYLYIGRGEFPEQVKLTKRSVAWFESEIKEWLKSRPRAK